MDNHHRPSRDGATIGLRYVGDKGAKEGMGVEKRRDGERDRDTGTICVILTVCDVTILVYCMAPQKLTLHEI